MKLTNRQLRQIIKEELAKVLNESESNLRDMSSRADSQTGMTPRKRSWDDRVGKYYKFVAAPGGGNAFYAVNTQREEAPGQYKYYYSSGSPSDYSSIMDIVNQAQKESLISIEEFSAMQEIPGPHS